MVANYDNLGIVAEQQENKDKAKRYWKMSVELYKYLGSSNEKVVQGWLNSL